MITTESSATPQFELTDKLDIDKLDIEHFFWTQNINLRKRNST